MNNLPPGYAPYPPAWPYVAYPPTGATPAGNPFAAPPAYPNPAMTPVAVPAPTNTLANPRFLKGALVGALAAYLLTNDNVQQAVINGSVKAWSLLQGGVEEMKERFRDAEAELHAQQAQMPDED
jgi:hypothetical protein